jgi:hypothetical protein
MARQQATLAAERTAMEAEAAKQRQQARPRPRPFYVFVLVSRGGDGGRAASRQSATAERAAAAEPAAEAAPGGGGGFATAWDQSTFHNARFPTALSARAVETGLMDGAVNVFGGAALPARGRHAWTVAFAGAAGGDLGNRGFAFAGVAGFKTGAYVGLSNETGAYGLRDNDDEQALRADGEGKGAVRRNAHGRAFSRGDSITCVADMDARPRTLALYRNVEPEPLGTVAGFGAEVYVCAAYVPAWGKCDELVLSFGGGPVSSYLPPK